MKFSLENKFLKLEFDLEKSMNSNKKNYWKAYFHVILFSASTYSPYMIHGLSESSRFNHEFWWPSRDSNPGPLGHEARILPLDYKALQSHENQITWKYHPQY